MVIDIKSYLFTIQEQRGWNTSPDEKLLTGYVKKKYITMFAS